MKVIDLCKTDNHEVWAQFDEILREARTGGDRNAGNYYDLRDKIAEHDCFHVMIDEIGAIGFAGLYNGSIYPDNIARALNRAYYAKRVRQTGLTANNKKRVVGGQMARWILPEQVRIAREKGYEGIFFSMEFNTRSRAIVNIAKWINTHDRSYEESWITEEHMYFTCPDYEACRSNKTCWQNVAVLAFEPQFELQLDRITHDEWTKRFSNESS